MGFGILAARKVEDDGRSIVPVHSPRIAHLHNRQHSDDDLRNAADVSVQSLQWLDRRRLLRLLNQSVYSFGFVFLVVVIEQLSVLLNGTFNHMAVDEDVLVLHGFGLLDLTVGVDVLSGL